MNKMLLLCNSINKSEIGAEISCPGIACTECVFKDIDDCDYITIKHKEISKKYVRDNAKEINIHNVIEFIEEGEEFESSFNIVTKVNGRIKITSKNPILDSVYIALDEVFCRKIEIITFNEAYEAMKDGKIVKALNSNLVYKDGFYKCDDKWNKNSVYSIDEIEGKWTVVEEEI